MGPTVNDYDVIVVGAGPGGAVASLLLARRGLRVLLIDKATFPRDKPCAEYLSPEINVLLDRLGLRDTLDRLAPARLRGFIVTPASGRPFRGDFPPTGPRSYGPAVARTRLDAALVDAAGAAGVTVREGFRVDQLRWERGLVAGVVGRQRGSRTEEVLRGRAVVGADGLHSVVARRLGLTVPSRSLRRIALVTHLRGIASLSDYGEMHVGYGEYAGIAPLGGGLANVAIVVPAEVGPTLRGSRDQYFRDTLSRFPGLRGRLDGAEATKPLLAIGPLATQSRRYVFPGGLLLGDAARFYDPFTGEGIYRAMAGAELAADVLASALNDNDLSVTRLARFERRYRAAFDGKYLVERLVQAIVSRPRVFNHVARRLASRPHLADRLVGVTGDFLPPITVLSPAYLARIML